MTNEKNTNLKETFAGENVNLSVEKTDKEKKADLYVHKFKKPVIYDGKSIEELTFDWGSLTGADALKIEEELAMKRINVIAPEFNAQYLICMATRACREKIGSDFFECIPLWDFNKIRNTARAFLLLSGRA